MEPIYLTLQDSDGQKFSCFPLNTILYEIYPANLLFMSYINIMIFNVTMLENEGCLLCHESLFFERTKSYESQYNIA